MFCEYCGVQINAEDKICSQCGAINKIIDNSQKKENIKKNVNKKFENKPYRVLLVIQSMFLTKQLETMLTFGEFNGEFKIVACATDGVEGLNKYKELISEIDIVIMEIKLPAMDGISTLEKIMEFDKDAYVIMVSALGLEDKVKKALQIGAKSYIVKPFDRKKVLERVSSVVNG